MNEGRIQNVPFLNSYFVIFFTSKLLTVNLLLRFVTLTALQYSAFFLNFAELIPTVKKKTTSLYCIDSL
jgi:hypothetical protein